MDKYIPIVMIHCHPHHNACRWKYFFSDWLIFFFIFKQWDLETVLHFQTYHFLRFFSLNISTLHFPVCSARLETLCLFIGLFSFGLGPRTFVWAPLRRVCIFRFLYLVLSWEIALLPMAFKAACSLTLESKIDKGWQKKCNYMRFHCYSRKIQETLDS